MPQSSYVFESGEAIEVGSHGQHDYVFSGGSPVSDTGQSTLVFESGSGLGAGDIIDDFERGNLDPYDTSNDGGYFSVTTTNVVNGTYSLRVDLDYSDENTYHISSTSGLPTYPQKGDKFSFWYRAGGTAGDKTSFHWNTQNPDNGYYVRINQSDGSLNYQKAALWRNSTKVIDPGNAVWDAQADTWYEVIVDWGTDDTFTLEVRDINGNTVQGPHSGTDDNPLSAFQGIVWQYGVAGDFGSDTTTVYFDYARVI